MSGFFFLLLVIYSKCYQYEMIATFTDAQNDTCCINSDYKFKPSSCTVESEEEHRYKIVWDSSIMITTGKKMFYRCKELLTLDASKFDTSEITDMSYMLSGKNNLEYLNIKNFDTRKAKTMSGMFSYCNCLTSLDISNFNTNEVTNMCYMFLGWNNLIVY